MTADQYRTLLLAAVRNVRDQTVNGYLETSNPVSDAERQWAEGHLAAIDGFELILSVGS